MVLVAICVRLFDETAELHGANYGGSDGLEGYSTCKTDINTQEVPTYALFSGNDDAICIAWTGVASGGRQQRYGFHAGNGAHACDRIGDRGSTLDRKSPASRAKTTSSVPGLIARATFPPLASRSTGLSLTVTTHLIAA